MVATVSLNLNLSKKLNEFVSFHEKLKREVNKHSISIAQEQSFLNATIQKYQADYYRELDQLGEICINFSLQQRKAVFQQLSKAGLKEMLKNAPYFYHSIFKPRGYAGDAEMMALIYRNQYEGNNLFDKVMHKLGTECEAGTAIRNRRQLMLNELKNLEKGKVLSLAAGPAQEIYDSIETGDNQLEFTALDHDIVTIKNAQNKVQSPNLKYAICNAFDLINGNKKILFPRAQFLPYCDPKKDFWGKRKKFLPVKYEIEELKPASYDIIYSIGLFDYLRTYPSANRGTTQLTKILFDLLKPGGKLLIGNVSHAMPLGIIWTMNCICDWYLIHRSEQEVIDFANKIPFHQIKNLEVVTEPSGVNYFLKIEKEN